MTKYRIRLKNGRVIGPFIMSQLQELRGKGHIHGNEEAQVFPTGAWAPIKTFEFYAELDGVAKNPGKVEAPKEETFVIDLTKLRNQKNEAEIEKIDVTHHVPVDEITETVRISAPVSETKPAVKPISPSTTKVEPTKTSSTQSKFELELDQAELLEETDKKKSAAANEDRTMLNPEAQLDLERIRKEQKAAEEKRKQEEEKKKLEDEAKAKAEAEKRLRDADESTQMLTLSKIKNELMVVAEQEELAIEKELKIIEKKRKEQAAQEEQDDDEDEEDESAAKKKKIKLIGLVAIAAICYAIFFPKEEVAKKPAFKHLDPKIEFPIPFDKADSKRAKVEYDKARQLFALGTYPALVKAGTLLKSSYENNIDSEEILNLLVRTYAEQLKYSKDKLIDAQVIFNMIQTKRPFLAKDPNGVIGLNLFYMNINKYDAAADVVSKYLKLYPKNVTQDLFAVYLSTLIKIGKLDLAKQFRQPLLKAPQKNRYTYDALIEYALLNQETEQAREYIDEGLKANPKLVGFYLKKADFLIKEKKFKEAEAYLRKSEELNLEYNDINRAKFMELTGLLLAYKGNTQKATMFFQKSLSIQDSDELRLRLSELKSTDEPQNETDKLINESKAIKQLQLAREFYDKRNYEIALSQAAKATDVMPGHIPSELFLAKVQLKLGQANPALRTLEELIKKYPDDKNINFALIDAYIDTYKFNDAKNRIAIMGSTDLKNGFEFASASGRLYLQMGDSMQALSWLRTSINMNPLNDRDIFILAEVLIKRSNFDAAKTLLEKCMELDPVNPDYRIAYAKIIYEKQDDQAAIGYLLGQLEEFPDNPKILSEIAIMYYRAGKVKDFEAYKAKLEKLPQKDKSLYEFMIKAALLDERFNDIPLLVNELLRIEPGSLEQMMTAGRVLFENGKLAEAAEWFKRIKSKLDTYPKVQYYIAKIKYMSKDFEGALADVQADIKANGENDADLTLMAQIMAAQDKLVEAENLYKKAQKINPKSYDSLMGLADISTKRNNFDLALDLYKKAMKEKSDEPVVHRQIGDVYRRLGQGALAVESYKLYLEMAPEASDKATIESYINLMQ